MHLRGKLEPTEYALKGNDCIGGKVEPTEYVLKGNDCIGGKVEPTGYVLRETIALEERWNLLSMY